MRILIVDDDHDVRRMLHRGLAIMGHQVLVAENGTVALSLLGEREVDLVLTDLFMPEMDGFEFLKELRRHNTSLPAIALSGGGQGMSGDFFLKIASKLGVHCTLQKPFSLTEVSMAIESCMLQRLETTEQAHCGHDAEPPDVSLRPGELN